MKSVSKSQLKPRLLEYLREVEETRKPLVVTDRGKPVVKVVPYADDPDEIRERLRNSVVRYDDPTEPVDLEEWSVLK